MVISHIIPMYYTSLGILCTYKFVDVKVSLGSYLVYYACALSYGCPEGSLHNFLKGDFRNLIGWV